VARAKRREIEKAAFIRQIDPDPGLEKQIARRKIAHPIFGRPGKPAVIPGVICVAMSAVGC
jgi:hypothetical protein